MLSAMSTFFVSVKEKQELIFFSIFFFFLIQKNLSCINLVFYFFKASRLWHQGSNQLWMWECTCLIDLQVQVSLEETYLQTQESCLF